MAQNIFEYYANLLIMQYLQKSKAYSTIKAQTLPVLMPQPDHLALNFSENPTNGTFEFSGYGEFTKEGGTVSEQLNSPPINWNDTTPTNIFSYTNAYPYTSSSLFTYNDCYQSYGNFTAPDGTPTATRLIENTLEANHFLSFTKAIQPDSTDFYTYSFYVKRAGINARNVEIYTTAGVFNEGVDASAVFDLSGSGSIDSENGGTATITAVGNDWFRCTFTGNAYAGTGFFSFNIYIVDNTFSDFYFGDNYSGLLIWGIQLEKGSVATPFTASIDTQYPGTTASITGTYFDNAGNVAYNTAGTLRKSYDPLNPVASNWGYLIESGSVNLFDYSNNFTLGSWTRTGATIANDFQPGPDFVLGSPSILKSTATTGTHSVQCFVTKSASTDRYSFSVFLLKASTGTGKVRVSIQATAGTANSAWINFDLSTLQPETITANESGTFIESYFDYFEMANGWIRVTISARTGSTTAVYGAVFATNASYAISWTATAVNQFYLFGAQMENMEPTSLAGSSTYIPTNGSFAQRNDDQIESAPAINYTETAQIVQDKLNKIPFFSNVTVTGKFSNLVIYIDLTNKSGSPTFETANNTLSNVNGSITLTLDYDPNNLLPGAVQDAFNLTGVTAVGDQLDILAKYVGASRNTYFRGNPITLTDAQLLTLINFAIAQNKLYGSLYDIEQVLTSFLGTAVWVFDHSDMRMTYYIDTTYADQALLGAIFSEGFLLRPMGVSLAVMYLTALANYFGCRNYYLVTPNNKPFNNYSGFTPGSYFLSYRFSLN